MMSFVHVGPRDVPSIVRALSANGARIQDRHRVKVIAGGTDLIREMRDGVVAPEQVIDLKAIPNMAYIRENGADLQIGSMAVLADLEYARVVRDNSPILAQASLAVASPQIRNVGTLGGNLCQRVRCWYYRNPMCTACYKRGGDTCFAVMGDNTYHAIMNGALCFAVHPSDTAVALMALDARVKIAGSNGERVVPLDRFFITPDVDFTRDNILTPSEIVTEVQVPKQNGTSRGIFLKEALRKSIDFAIVSVGVVLNGRSGVVSNARIVLGGVAHRPLRAVSAEQLLAGQRLTESLAQQAADTALNGAKPLRMNGYKVVLARNLVKRALLAVA